MHNFQLSTLDSQLSTLYFLGIGGIGMSAIARYFKAKAATFLSKVEKFIKNAAILVVEFCVSII